MKKRNYGLFTAVTMIVGIIIGSGIFFKADDVLAYSGGNVHLGLLLFAVGAIAVIFGSLTIAQLAMKTDKPGGLVTYAEDFVGMGTSCVFGWFQTFLYMPTLSAIVAWITGMYVCQLFGWSPADPVLAWGAIGGGVLLFTFVCNMLSAKLGGALQNLTVIVKLIPLMLIAVLGLVFGNPGPVLAQSQSGFSSALGIGVLAAFGPIAFSFDGWVISTSVCHEIKNSKRNLPLALTVAPIVILIAYSLYFVGISAYLGPETVMEVGDNAPYLAASGILGPAAAKVVLVAIIISVLGTVNGVVLGMIRMPYSLAKRNMMPFFNKQLSKTNPRLGDMPINSALLCMAVTGFWMVVHLVWSKAGYAGDISEIAIGMSYLLYIVLYVTVIRMFAQKKIKGVIKGVVLPVLAIIGSIIILSGSVTSKMFPFYAAICAVVVAGGALYYHKNKAKIRPTVPEDYE